MLGLPGYPLAAQTALREFAAPLLESWGFARPRNTRSGSGLPRRLHQISGSTSSSRYSWAASATSLWGTPLIRGPVVQTATVKANGYTHIPAAVEGYEAGTELEVLLTTDPGSIERTLIVTGTLDPALEELANLVHDQGLFIHASNMGNLAGMLALSRRTCHAAASACRPIPPPGVPAPCPPSCHGCDRLCPSCISRLWYRLPGRPWVRTTHKGTDYQYQASPRDASSSMPCSAPGIDPGMMNGTGTRPAARRQCTRGTERVCGYCDPHRGNGGTYGLRFVPAASEDYELAIRRDMLADTRISSLIALVRTPAYRAILGNTGGYTTGQTGINPVLVGRYGP